MSEKIYPIPGEEVYGLYPGKTLSGRQLLGCVGYYETVVVEFDKDGTMLKDTVYPVASPKIKPEDKSMAAYVRAQEKEAELIRDYLKTLGFASFETIHVKEFWVDGYAIGIQQYPAYLQDVLESEEKGYTDIDISPLPEYNRIHFMVDAEPDEEELADLREDLERWRKSGDFVLYFGNDYWCDKTGYIHSS